MFETEVVDKIKTHTFFPLRSCL